MEYAYYSNDASVQPLQYPPTYEDQQYADQPQWDHQVVDQCASAPDAYAYGQHQGFVPPNAQPEVDPTYGMYAADEHHHQQHLAQVGYQPTTVHHLQQQQGAGYEPTMTYQQPAVAFDPTMAHQQRVVEYDAPVVHHHPHDTNAMYRHHPQAGYDAPQHQPFNHSAFEQYQPPAEAYQQPPVEVYPQPAEPQVHHFHHEFVLENYPPEHDRNVRRCVSLDAPPERASPPAKAQAKSLRAPRNSLIPKHAKTRKPSLASSDISEDEAARHDAILNNQRNLETQFRRKASAVGLGIDSSFDHIQANVAMLQPPIVPSQAHERVIVVPVTPQTPPKKKEGIKKPALACLFCRKRKIACGQEEVAPGMPPSASCNQCARRCQDCKYPTESRRGVRKPKDSSKSTNKEPVQPTIHQFVDDVPSIDYVVKGKGRRKRSIELAA